VVRRRHLIQPKWACLAAVIAFGSACGGGVGSVKAGFRAAAQEIDFGTALLGEELRRSIALVSTGRAEVTVVAETSDPFRAPASITIPAGTTVELEVAFVAPDGVAQGTLRLSGPGESFEVSLRGRGVRPLECLPSAPCRVTRFDLQSESCVESMADDGAACTPQSRCLENGVCRAGTCDGTPRSCDDGNECTDDSCSLAVGCVHVDRSSECPAPENRCEVATCNPSTGRCEPRPRPDGSVCDAVDCVTANLCVSGVCLPLPTPEGFLCAPATPCQGEGHCTSGQCVRPDAGTLSPEWSIVLGAPPGPVVPEPGRMAALSGNVFFPLCGLASQDGGCGLVSYTRNGFLRFDRPFGDVLHSVSASGVVVSGGGALAARSTASGDVLWSLPLDPGSEVLPGGVAVASSGEIFAAVSRTKPGGPTDGGDASVDVPPSRLLQISSDGGVRAADPVDAGARVLVALDPLDAPVVHAPGGAVSFSTPVDGGLDWTTFDAREPAPLLSLGGAGQYALVGGRVAIARDGGASIALVARDGGEEPAGIDALALDDIAYAFFRACRPPALPACSPDERAVGVRALALGSGTQLWEAMVLPPLAPGFVVEAALATGVLSGGVLTLTEATIDGGVRADVQLFIAGERAMLCPLDGAPHVHGAVFHQDALFAIVERGGLWRIEAFDLAGLPLSSSGWSRTSGESGTRRERP
jgi:hypothetical protein